MTKEHKILNLMVEKIKRYATNTQVIRPYVLETLGLVSFLDLQFSNLLNQTNYVEFSVVNGHVIQ